MEIYIDEQQNGTISYEMQNLYSLNVDGNIYDGVQDVTAEGKLSISCCFSSDQAFSILGYVSGTSRVQVADLEIDQTTEFGDGFTLTSSIVNCLVDEDSITCQEWSVGPNETEVQVELTFTR